MKGVSRKIRVNEFVQKYISQEIYSCQPYCLKGGDQRRNRSGTLRAAECLALNEPAAHLNWHKCSWRIKERPGRSPCVQRVRSCYRCRRAPAQAQSCARRRRDAVRSASALEWGNRGEGALRAGTPVGDGRGLDCSAWSATCGRHSMRADAFAVSPSSMTTVHTTLPPLPSPTPHLSASSQPSLHTAPIPPLAV